jgi:hypothetical protein
MSKAAILRAFLALVVAVASVGVTVSQAGFAVMGGGVGVRVGVPGAGVELARAVVPIVVMVLFAVLAIRFGIRALRSSATIGQDLARGGKLLATVAWAAWTWLVLELLYRLVWLGGATLFGNLAVTLWVCAAVVLACFLVERRLPWSQAPRGVRHLGLSVVALAALLTALSAWSHRGVVPKSALVPVAVVALVFLASGVKRVEAGPRERMFVELVLASLLLAGPIGGFLA